jgi:hypothetical protein
MQIIFKRKERKKEKKKKKKKKEKKKKENKRGHKRKWIKAPCNNNDLVHTTQTWPSPLNLC